jgi:hypothetical protein
MKQLCRGNGRRGADGAPAFDIIGDSAKTAGNLNVAIPRNSQLFQLHTRPGRPSFSLAVQLSSMPNRPKAMMYGANGIDIIGEFA